jgi:hypothetical protein
VLDQTEQMESTIQIICRIQQEQVRLRGLLRARQILQESGLSNVTDEYEMQNSNLEELIARNEDRLEVIRNEIRDAMIEEPAAKRKKGM